MRKLWILLVVLMVVGLPMFAADTAIKGNFLWMGNTDPDGADSAALLKARTKFDTKLDDFNQLYAEIRWGAGTNWNPATARIKAFRLTTDVIGALGLDVPVTAKVQAGVWESDFMAWRYATQAGWEYVLGSHYDQQQANGAARLDVGFGPVTVYGYHNFAAVNGLTAFGAIGEVGPVVLEASYITNPQTFGDGKLGVEAGFSQDVGPLALSVYPAFYYDLDPAAASAPGPGYTEAEQEWAWDLSVGGTYDMFGLALAAQGEKRVGRDAEAFRKLVAELNVNPVENLSLFVTLYMDLGEQYEGATDMVAFESSFQGLDIMVSYKLGAAKFLLGYMVGGKDGTDLPVYAWNTDYVNGLYAGIDASF